MPKRSYLLLFPVLLLLTAFQPQKLQHPPIPREDPHTEKIAIVLTEQPVEEQHVKKELEKFKNTKLRHVFTQAINGYSVQGPASELKQLEETEAVLFVSEVHTYKVENATHLQPKRYQSSSSFIDNFELIGTEAVHGLLDEKGNHLTGKGITVGVIDTGIDYEHPDLRRSYAGGHDLVDGDNDPMETNGFGFKNTLHGTHVAGVIAANGRMRGMAPEAKIVAYRALGPGGSGTTEQVLAAIDEAINDQVDILNLSLGNDVNGPDLPISLAINKAVDSGIVAVTSSGNSGPNRWTVGSPGTASKAISVGASTPPMQIPYIDSPGTMGKIRLELLQGSDNWRITQSEHLVFAGLGRKSDMTDVQGKLVLVERGTLTFTEKAKNALEAGAIGVMIYNNTNGTFFGNLEETMPIPVAAISKEAGLALKQQLKNKSMLIRIHLIEETDILADFSSRGPVTSTWEIKPDIVAPGVAINSTIPGGYLSLQGTSMAAPHIAGAAALIKQAHPDWTPAEIKAAIMNTAKDIKDHSEKSYRTFEQGAGRIQTEAAIETDSLVIPGSLQFGQFQLSDNLHRHSAKLTVKNTGSSRNSYAFSIPKMQKGIEWELPLSFSLKPGESKEVELAMKVTPELLDDKVKDGTLVLDDGTHPIRIPYLYVLEEPDYPRVMGFGFAPADTGNGYRYEVYLPGGADEFGIALFDPDHFRFLGFLDWGRELKKGMVTKELPLEKLPEDGVYLAKVFAKKAGRENMIETMLYIDKASFENRPRKR